MPRRRSGFQKKIETVHWTYGSFAMSALAAGAQAEAVYPAQHLPETLLRTRGEVIIYIDGVESPGVSAAIGIGMIQVPEGTGTTVLWSPIVDGDAPWIWVDYFGMAYEESTVNAIQYPAISGVRRLIDSKAMRKIRNTELQVVAENATVIAALSVNILGNMRVLSGS